VDLECLLTLALTSEKNELDIGGNITLLTNELRKALTKLPVETIQAVSKIIFAGKSLYYKTLPRSDTTTLFSEIPGLLTSEEFFKEKEEVDGAVIAFGDTSRVTDWVASYYSFTIGGIEDEDKQTFYISSHHVFNRDTFSQGLSKEAVIQGFSQYFREAIAQLYLKVENGEPGKTSLKKPKSKPTGGDLSRSYPLGNEKALKPNQSRPIKPTTADLFNSSEPLPGTPMGNLLDDGQISNSPTDNLNGTRDGDNLAERVVEHIMPKISDTWNNKTF